MTNRSKTLELNTNNEVCRIAVVGLMEDGSFEAISNPLRIRTLTLLSQKSMGFTELKRELGIRSSEARFSPKKTGRFNEIR